MPIPAPWSAGGAAAGVVGGQGVLGGSQVGLSGGSYPSIGPGLAGGPFHRCRSRPALLETGDYSSRPRSRTGRGSPGSTPRNRAWGRTRWNGPGYRHRGLSSRAPRLISTGNRPGASGRNTSVARRVPSLMGTMTLRSRITLNVCCCVIANPLGPRPGAGFWQGSSGGTECRRGYEDCNRIPSPHICVNRYGHDHQGLSVLELRG